MTMWERIFSEVKWFFTALALSSVLSLVYVFFYWMIDRQGVPDSDIGMRTFLAGWLTMFCCLYTGRILVRFLKVAMSADPSTDAP